MLVHMNIHKVLVTDIEAEQVYCISGLVFASPPWVLFVPSISPIRAKTLLGALNCLFYLTKSSFRSYTP